MGSLVQQQNDSYNESGFQGMKLNRMSVENSIEEEYPSVEVEDVLPEANEYIEQHSGSI